MYYENVNQNKIIIFRCSRFCMNKMPPEALTGTDVLGGKYRWDLTPALTDSICPLASKEQVLGLVLLCFYYSLGRSLQASIIN